MMYGIQHDSKIANNVQYKYEYNTCSGAKIICAAHTVHGQCSVGPGWVPPARPGLGLPR